MRDVENDVLETVALVPDESITDAIGRGHTLATAVADIIDNSLDANAERILIRFVVEDDRLVAVRIRDDGTGMTPPDLLESMTLGKQRKRSEGALGHFGIGLKAASLSQALTLTVYSRNFDAEACAVRIRRGSFTGEILEERVAKSGYEWDARGPASTGTVVEWRDLETINHSQIAAERRSWLDRTITGLAHALGLTFHRLIELRGIRITIDTWDERTRAAGPPRNVEPRDPFQFTLTGKAGYPTVISASTSDGALVEAECFMLPPRSDSASVWLLGRNPVDWQGVYIYRNDRLLQAGGWLDVRPDDKRLRLARLRIDLTDSLERHLRLRHEKSGVTSTPEFSAALEAATNDAGVTLDVFRSDAIQVLKASNARTNKVKPAVPVADGLPDRVIEAVRDELGVRDADPLRIAWGMLPEGKLFELQLEKRNIVLNLGYRAALGGDENSLVPTLLYLLLEAHFTKGWLGSGTKAQIDAWEKIAAAAMLAQLGDTAFDALADWSTHFVSESVELDMPAVGGLGRMGPRPAPPSVDLRWAYLGQRGQIHSEEISSIAENVVRSVAEESSGEDVHGALEVEELRAMTSDPDKNASDIDLATGSQPTQIDSVPQYSAAPLDARPGDREIVSLYRAGTDIETIASTLGSEFRDVAIRLCALLLDLEGDDIDDANLAAMHGQPYTPPDREKILEMYRGGAPVRRIADHLMRTPFAIGWQLLSSPKRPVEIPKNLLRRIDRALESGAGAPRDL